MKKVAILSLILLGGCASDPIKLVAPEYKLVKPPEDFYQCPTVKKFPKPETLTNQQVGSLLITLEKNNLVCKNSINSIKDYMDQAEAQLKKK